MSAEALYLRDLVPRVLRDAVATLDGPAPSNEVQKSFRQQHPQPAKRTHRHADNRSEKSRHPLEYNSWKASKKRCSNEADPSWRYYGAIGITFHEPWADPVSGFALFLRDVGPKPTPAHVLARRNKNGNYEPGNVLWMKRGDIRVGVRSDRKYDEHQEAREVRIPGDRADCTKDVCVFERSGVIGIGTLMLSANQADQVALALVRMAHQVRSKRLK